MSEFTTFKSYLAGLHRDLRYIEDTVSSHPTSQELETVRKTLQKVHKSLPTMYLSFNAFEDACNVHYKVDKRKRAECGASLNNSQQSTSTASDVTCPHCHASIAASYANTSYNRPSINPW